jgi:hypothetical protein
MVRVIARLRPSNSLTSPALIESTSEINVRPNCPYCHLMFPFPASCQLAPQVTAYEGLHNAFPLFVGGPTSPA